MPESEICGIQSKLSSFEKSLSLFFKASDISFSLNFRFDFLGIYKFYKWEMIAAKKETKKK